MAHSSHFTKRQRKKKKKNCHNITRSQLVSHSAPNLVVNDRFSHSSESREAMDDPESFCVSCVPRDEFCEARFGRGLTTPALHDRRSFSLKETNGRASVLGENTGASKSTTGREKEKGVIRRRHSLLRDVGWSAYFSCFFLGPIFPRGGTTSEINRTTARSPKKSGHFPHWVLHNSYGRHNERSRLGGTKTDQKKRGAAGDCCCQRNKNK